MPAMNPFEDESKPSHAGLPWMSLVIIAMMTALVG